MKSIGQSNAEKYIQAVNAATNKLEVRELTYRLADVPPSTFSIVEPSFILDGIESIIDLCELRPTIARQIAEMDESIRSAQTLNNNLGKAQLIFGN